MWVGFDTVCFEYEYVERAAGETKWSFWKLTRYAVEGIVSFSTAPLKIATAIGSVVRRWRSYTWLSVSWIALIWGNLWPGILRCWRLRSVLAGSFACAWHHRRICGEDLHAGQATPDLYPEGKQYSGLSRDRLIGHSGRDRKRIIKRIN